LPTIICGKQARFGSPHGNVQSAIMAVLRRVIGFAGLAVVAILLFAGGWIVGRTGIGSVVDPASLPDLERTFVEDMRDVSLVGVFSVAGRDDVAPRSDRYDIRSVQKVGENLWQFNASMSCCGLSGAAIPIVVPMRWVGDTPMIEMTDHELPAIGRFTARVFFYGDRYAGTWQNPRTGGHMWGRIERRKTTS
jgi:hypothetical protein